MDPASTENFRSAGLEQMPAGLNRHFLKIKIGSHVLLVVGELLRRRTGCAIPSFIQVAVRQSPFETAEGAILRTMRPETFGGLANRSNDKSYLSCGV